MIRCDESMKRSKKRATPFWEMRSARCREPLVEAIKELKRENFQLDNKWNVIDEEKIQLKKKLEQAYAEEMAIRIGCSKCRHTMCRRNPKYEGEQDLFEVGCDLFRRFKNDAILVLADIRGESNGIE